MTSYIQDVSVCTILLLKYSNLCERGSIFSIKSLVTSLLIFLRFHWKKDSFIKKAQLLWKVDSNLLNLFMIQLFLQNLIFFLCLYSLHSNFDFFHPKWNLHLHFLLFKISMHVSCLGWPIQVCLKDISLESRLNWYPVLMSAS